MYWADQVAKEIVDSGKFKPYWVDDMKTPSGRIHVGSLRGVIIHDLVYKALLGMGEDATFTWVYDNHDPMDAMPVYLDANMWSKYLGQPLFSIPAPDEKSENYAKYFADEFTQIFDKTGCHPKIIWALDLYTSGKMNAGIKKCLDEAGTIRTIYETTYKKKLPENWYPFQVVCPHCGKESTTKVTDWDGEKVAFQCNVEGLDWVKGCGYEGKTSPFSSKDNFVGKLSWKVEWAVKWQVIGVTIEGAGKDHMTAGGSHSIASAVCEKVLNYPVPFPVAYEFFLIGGRKMSSSKGLGSSAKEVSEIMPPYLLRFLFARADYREAIDFTPGGMVIPDLFDEYDRCWQAYNQKGDEKLARTFVLSQPKGVPDRQDMFLPRFRDVANYIQLAEGDLTKKFAEVKGKDLTPTEKEILDERVDYAKLWLERYAPEDFKVQMVAQMPEVKLSKKQKEYLAKVVGLVEEEDNADKLQTALYDLSKEVDLPAREAFAAVYQVFIGKNFGPRAGQFLLQYPKDKVLARLKEATE